MARDFSSLVQQDPLNVGGIFAPKAFVAPARLHFTATGGIVGTAYGFPGLGVTLVATGLYDVIHPPVRFAQLYTTLQTPSGAFVDRAIVRQRTNAWSGIASVQFSVPGNSPTGVAAPSGGSRQAVIPPSGTILDLLWVGSPTSNSGITPF